ncbi:hypothetical protein [Halorarius litoreus]|uniref:hypothetical protein n=1 Tax=Halorarius litoreus TaxID=2962676 RepID=UPI0020CDC6C2|nr:hypothetical protein [Halorarius litoreus]
MSSSYPRPSLVAVVLLVLVSGVGAATGAVVAPGNPPEPTTENRPPSDGANFTISPDDHSPGANTAYLMQSKGEGPWGDSRGLETIDFYKITTQETMFQDCTPNDARAFGIDRGNDEPGTKTNTALLSHMKKYSVSGRIISVEIYDEGDLGGSPTYLNRSDETVAKLANCVVAPSEPGWYQFTGYVNGTNYAGEFQEVTLYSNYFYICDCSSREEAEQTLGPPPHSGGGDASSTPTATATPRRTTTATVTATATPTPVATPEPTRETETATAAPDRDAGPTASTTATTGAPPVGSAESTVTSEADQAATVPGTPTTLTLATGPGFGALLTLVAVAFAVLGRRR